MAKEKSVPVTSLKTLAGTVPSFDLPVNIKRLDGTETAVTFNAKAMRKTEWADLRDAHMKPINESEKDGEQPAKFSFSAVVGEDMRKGAELISKCASGWDLADEFNPENLIELEDSFGGTLGSFLSAYDAAIFHGRLGNSAA
ncbi:Phage tail assembly chaperone [Polaromonas sp. OV174]|uniref:phage tail assembly chaperone n=1 Tax=Polaromonas sp. OV174 TaxID=1855300 RepID=UPI0008DF08DE|nr:phage tail assembly chaperone [Polaromonas sp. OV174]SFB74106.1 Phage tail assembly chaperone [Polaromonas sp. OV174]